MGRRRLKKKYRRALWAILGGIVAIILISTCAKHCKRVEPEPEPIIPSNYFPTIRNLKGQFNDLNPLHVEAGLKYGLKEAPKDREEVKADKLVLIEDNKYYVVDELTHSVPYLCKSGSLLLDELGRNFCDSLKAKNILPVRFKVTSVLRTKADVEKLRRAGNVNASPNSSHCYGCTFDIAWASWDLPERYNATWDQYRGVLAEVLRDEQKAGRCYVKYEYKESCFHITSRIDPRHPDR